ncbi:hypothetical protein Goarm_000379 [Gossypium armourianum]|uniref:Myosin motor domain-containing protein n=1 Tax=Gossypium armourianum TaxID=34283 RepID=A0A7J9K9Y8_9ROSI|nr:hypothetical protein [Gossypium armourianum]
MSYSSQALGYLILACFKLDSIMTEPSLNVFRGEPEYLRKIDDLFKLQLHSFVVLVILYLLLDGSILYQGQGLINVAKLIGCDAADLNLALSTRKMRVGSDNIVQKLTLSQAVETRDALAKSIYAGLFEWLVEQINKSLAVGKRLTGRSISILDIYGFESFDVCFNNAFILSLSLWLPIHPN